MRHSVPVFLINLDRDAERLQAMTQELGRIELAFQRVPAIYGTQVPDYLRRYFLDPDGNIASNLKRGEVGCYASHLHILHEIVNRNLPHALVLEDDLHFSDRFAELLEQLLRFPRVWDIIRLSNAAKRSFVPVSDIMDGYRLVKYSRIPNNTGAYLISAAGASKFIRFAGLRGNPVDVDLRRCWRFGLYTFGVLPPPIQSNVVASRIDSMEDRGHGGVSFIRKAVNRITTGRTEFGLNTMRRIAYNIHFLGWRNWLRCTVIDHFHSVARRFRIFSKASMYD